MPFSPNPKATLSPSANLAATADLADPVVKVATADLAGHVVKVATADPADPVATNQLHKANQIFPISRRLCQFRHSLLFLESIPAYEIRYVN